MLPLPSNSNLTASPGTSGACFFAAYLAVRANIFKANKHLRVGYMSSLNDYNWQGLNYEPRRRGGSGRRAIRYLLGQSVLALAFFFGVTGFIGASARYVMTSVMAVEDSWIAVGAPVEQQPGLPVSGTPDVADKAADDAAQQQVSGAGEMPLFSAPASGVVVRDVSTAGISAGKGVLIQGTLGQTVRAAAPGTVESITADGEGLLRISISHEGGYRSCYGGLSAAEVAAGGSVAGGAVIGSSESGSILFSIYSGTEELDPIEVLFGE